MIRSKDLAWPLMFAGCTGEPEPGSREAWCAQVEDVAAECGAVTGIDDCVERLDACTDDDLERLDRRSRTLLLLACGGPEAGLAPAVASAAREPYLQWMLHFSNTVQAAYARWFHPEVPAGGVAIDEVKAAARARIEESWDHLDAHLRANGPFVARDQLTVADLYATMLVRWSRNMPRPGTTWEAVAALVAAVKARPTWGELYAREGLTEWR